MVVIAGILVLENSWCPLGFGLLDKSRLDKCSLNLEQVRTVKFQWEQVRTVRFLEQVHKVILRAPAGMAVLLIRLSSRPTCPLSSRPTCQLSSRPTCRPLRPVEDNTLVVGRLPSRSVEDNMLAVDSRLEEDSSRLPSKSAEDTCRLPLKLEEDTCRLPLKSVEDSKVGEDSNLPWMREEDSTVAAGNMDNSHP